MGSLACLIAVVAWKYFSREPSIDQVAVLTIEAALGGDADFLTPKIAQFELDKLGMSRGQARRFLAEFVLPKFKGAHMVSQEHFTQGGQVSGVALATFTVDNSGTELRAGTNVDLSDDGPQLRLTHLLQMGWKFEYVRTFRNSPPRVALVSATWGLAKDKADLLRYGFKGFVPDDEAQPMRTLEAQQKRFDSALRSNTNGIVRMNIPGGVVHNEPDASK